MPDASASFLGLCGFSGRDFGLLAGKFDFVQSVWGVFTEFDVVANLLELFAMPCARVRRVRSVFESHGSGLPVRDSVPLAGKFGIADTFAGVLEPFTPSCTFPHTFSVFPWLSSLSNCLRATLGR